MRVKLLPKSFKHWVLSAGLRIDTFNSRTKREYGAGYYLIGRGRRWRINCIDLFDVSEPHETFDRWANSREDTFELPKTKNEFVNFVKNNKPERLK